MAFSAKEVLEQLGGNKFIAMTGARNFTKDKNSIRFRLPKANNGIKFVKIELTPMDTYTIEFGKGNVMSGYKVIKKIDDIYADQLVEIFSENTGLETQLHKIRGRIEKCQTS